LFFVAELHDSMIPKSGCRFPACAKPCHASADEGRSEKIMLKK
jgi:hypothetical protein